MTMPPNTETVQGLVGIGVFALLLFGVYVDLHLIRRWSALREHLRENRLRAAASPWELSDGLRILGILVMAQITVVAVGGLISGLADRDSPLALNTTLGMQATFVPLVTGLAVAGMLRMQAADRRRHAFGWQPVSLPRAFRYAVIGYLAMMPGALVVSWCSVAVIEALGVPVESQPVIQLLEEQGQSMTVRLVIGSLAVLIAPLIEEIVFRGILLPSVMKHTSACFAIAGVSAVFALIHLHMPSAPPLFAIAIAFSLAYLLTGSVLVPILMHAMFNATTLLALVVMQTL